MAYYPIDRKEVVGGRDRDRTGDPLLAKQVLSQLSYTPEVTAQQSFYSIYAACASTTWAMFVRTSDRGEPAKINFCNLRTSSLEKRARLIRRPFDFRCGLGGDCIALSMKRPSLGSFRFAKSAWRSRFFRDGRGRACTSRSHCPISGPVSNLL